MLHGMTKRCSPECRGAPGYHCTVCHNNFYTLRGFDDHRFDPDTPEDEDLICWEPSDCNMFLEKNMWANNAEHEKRRASEEKMAKARESRGKA